MALMRVGLSDDRLDGVLGFQAVSSDQEDRFSLGEICPGAKVPGNRHGHPTGGFGENSFVSAKSSIPSRISSSVTSSHPATLFP